MKKIRVLLADDHTLVRAGIRALLERQPDQEVVGEAADGLQAVRMTEELQPDVVLMDLAMPGVNGLEATARITKNFSRVKVLALTMHDDQEYFFEVLQAGASGYVLKNAAPQELVTAIRAVVEGKAYLSPGVARYLIGDFLRRAEPEARAYNGLTEREREVLKLIAQGMTNQEIAQALSISINTVQVHRTHIMDKLDLHNRAELIKYAIRKGLIQLKD